MARLKPGKYEPKGTLEERLQARMRAVSRLRDAYQVIVDKSQKERDEAQRIIYRLREQRAY